MAGTSAPKKGAKATKKAVVKKTAVKKVASKKAPVKKAVAKKSAVKKVATGPRRFPTKAELEALKLAREAEEQAKAAKKAAGRKLFPT